jgi:hypothetical protein
METETMTVIRSVRIGVVMRQQGAGKFGVHLAETRASCDVFN